MNSIILISLSLYILVLIFVFQPFKEDEEKRIVK